MNDIKIAIIMPCYYSSDRMIKAFESFKSQTKRNNIVLYMINDCSPNTDCEYQDVRDKYSPFIKIVYLKNEQNSGTGIARQKGLDNIKEDYLIFHDDDDFLFDEYVIEKYLNVIKEHPDVDIAFGKLTWAWNDVIQTWHTNNRHLFRGQLISKKFIDKYNLKFDKAVSYMGEDYVFFHKMNYYADMNHAKIIYTNEIVYVDNNYENIPTLTCGLVPINYGKNHTIINKRLTKIVFDKIRIYYELITFYKSHSGQLKKKHVEQIFCILKTVMLSCSLMMRMLENYGIKSEYSIEEIQELHDKWIFLLDLVKKNQDFIENKWIFDFDDPQEYREFFYLDNKMPFNEFYNTFEQRFRNLV